MRSLNYRRGRAGRPLARAKRRLYESDADTCCICGEWVDKSLPHTNPTTGKPDPMSKSIEHPDIERDPYWIDLAHLGCNVSEGGRRGAAITNSKKHTPQHTRYVNNDW